MILGASTLLSTTSSLAICAAGQSANQSQSLLGSLTQFAVDLGRRELNDVVTPCVRQHVNALLHRVPVSTLSADATIARWEALSVLAGERWVDIGSGNGETLGYLARRNEGSLIGIEKENSLPLLLEINEGASHLETLPPNVHFYVLTMNKPGREYLQHDRLEQARVKRLQVGDEFADAIQQTTLELLGRQSAAVVSLIFPYTEPIKVGAFGRFWRGVAPKPLHYQLRTALDLLRPGGMGVAILEASDTADQKRVLERALAYLRGQSDVASIQYSPLPLDTARLNIAAYAPENAGKAVDTEALATGRVVFFSRKNKRQA